MCIRDRIEAGQLELEPDHVGRENPERLLQELLACLVPFEDDYGRGVHGGASLSAARFGQVLGIGQLAREE